MRARRTAGAAGATPFQPCGAPRRCPAAWTPWTALRPRTAARGKAHATPPGGTPQRAPGGDSRVGEQTLAPVLDAQTPPPAQPLPTPRAARSPQPRAAPRLGREPRRPPVIFGVRGTKRNKKRSGRRLPRACHAVSNSARSRSRSRSKRSRSESSTVRAWVGAACETVSVTQYESSPLRACSSSIRATSTIASVVSRSRVTSLRTARASVSAPEAAAHAQSSRTQRHRAPKVLCE